MGYEQKNKKNQLASQVVCKTSQTIPRSFSGWRLRNRRGLGGAISATSGARAESAVDFAPLRLGLDEAEKPAKRKDSFRRAKRAVSRRWS
jgi:hypothetical protein